MKADHLKSTMSNLYLLITAGREELGIIIFKMNPKLRFENIPTTYGD